MSIRGRKNTVCRCRGGGESSGAGRAYVGKGDARLNVKPPSMWGRKQGPMAAKGLEKGGGERGVLSSRPKKKNARKSPPTRGTGERREHWEKCDSKNRVVDHSCSEKGREDGRFSGVVNHVRLSRQNLERAEKERTHLVQKKKGEDA